MTALLVAVILSVLYLGILVAAVLLSRRPYRIPIFHGPGLLGAPQEDTEFPAADGVRISGWWSPARDAKGVVVLSHGYYMNRSEPAAIAHYFWTQGYSTLLYDFPGAGRSQNRDSGFGWIERLDVLAAVRQARSFEPNGPMILWGSSMGAAASAFAAAEKPEEIDALILDSAYGRLLDAVSGWWLFIGGRWLAAFLGPTRYLAPLFLTYRADLADVAVALRAIPDKPVLLIHGEEDTMATPDQARRNADELGPHGRIAWFPDCQHSEPRLFYPERYRAELRAFLNELEEKYERSPALTRPESGTTDLKSTI